VAGVSKTLWEIGDIVKLVKAAEGKLGELVIPAEAPFRPLAFEAIGDGGANLVQGVENDRRRDFRANADVGAESESARNPLDRVLSDRLPKKFGRPSSLDRIEETINICLIVGQRGTRNWCRAKTTQACNLDHECQSISGNLCIAGRAIAPHGGRVEHNGNDGEGRPEIQPCSWVARLSLHATGSGNPPHDPPASRRKGPRAFCRGPFLVSVQNMYPGRSFGEPVTVRGHCEHHFSHRWIVASLTERSYHLTTRAPAPGSVHDAYRVWTARLSTTPH
jgi:hypothetical protein